jgi:23S rRNA (uracil1939-C5)-methyltransferase
LSFEGEERRSIRSMPVEVGEEYEVAITDVSRRGDAGIARISGLIIFVEDGKPGETVKVRITQVGSNYARAEKI